MAGLRTSYLSGFDMIRHNGDIFVNCEDPTDPQEMRREIEAHARRLLNRFVDVAQYAPAEMASWPVLLAECKAYAISANPVDTPFCQAEADDSGVDLQSVINRVTANANAYAAFLAQVKGARTRHKLAIAGMQAPEIFAYDWRDGWPA